MLRNLAACMRWWRYAAVSWLVAIACAAQAGPIWFADDVAALRLETDTNAVTLSVARRNVDALAIDARDGSLWALTDSNLLKYSADGVTLLSVDLRSLGRNFQNPSRLVLDPVDGSVWIGGGDDIIHVDATGHRIASVDFDDNVHDIALARDESLWVLAGDTVARYSPKGVQLGRARLDDGLRQSVFIAVDDANGYLWLAGSRSLYQLPLAFPLHTRLSRPLDEPASAMTLDTGTGTIWVAGDQSVFAFSKDGGRLADSDLSHRHLGDFRALEFDTQAHAVWLGHDRGLTRLDGSGRFVTTVPAFGKVDAIATSSAPTVVPIVTLVAPPDGTLTRNAFIPIQVHYDATCSGQPCSPPPDFGAYVLTATLNGVAIGGSFAFDPAGHNATFTPTARYTEGANAFSAFVTDGSGRKSSTITASFTVDTTAPQFVNVAPADGSVFTQPSVTMTGSVDDPAAHVLLESLSGAAITGTNPAGATFSFGLTLQPGTDSFRLTATDALGNATQRLLAYAFGTLSITVTSPVDGASVDDNKVTVTGTFAGSATATITVNGIAAIVAGQAFTAADVPLHPGSNTITVSGSTPLGATATRTLTVVSAAPSIALTSPANGATVTGASVLAAGTVQAPANSGVTVNGVVAFLDAGGNFFANDVPLQPGTNTLTATVTTQGGKSVSVNATVSSTGPAPLTITATPLQGVVPLTVTFDVENLASVPLASLSFDPGGPGSVAAAGPGDLFAFTYPAPGTYHATVTLLDSAGNSYPQPFVIQAQDPAQLDQLFRALWNGMNTALAAGDKAAAMTYLSAGAQEKYGPVFDKIMPQMPALIASYSTLQRVSLAPHVGEYAINRTIDGVNRIFFVYFLQDATGAWLIDQM